eukprot:2190392-Amphidinium_carterae.1
MGSFIWSRQTIRHPSLWVLVDRCPQQRKGVAGQWTDGQGRFRQLGDWFEADSIKAILGIYVDDFIAFACCQEDNDCLTKRVCAEWKASQKVPLKEDGLELLFVGIKMKRTSSGYVLHQTPYARGCKVYTYAEKKRGKEEASRNYRSTPVASYQDKA